MNESAAVNLHRKEEPSNLSLRLEPFRAGHCGKWTGPSFVKPRPEFALLAAPGIAACSATTTWGSPSSAEFCG
jgi:hypothetical protein